MTREEAKETGKAVTVTEAETEPTVNGPVETGASGEQAEVQDGQLSEEAAREPAETQPETKRPLVEKTRVEAQSAEIEKLTEMVEERPSDTVEYEGVFGEGTILRYQPLYSGFKEDLILQSYTGVHEFSFTVKTGGLSLIEEDGQYFFIDPLSGDKLVEMGALLVYASGETADGEYRHHYRVNTVVQDQEYQITAVVDEAFLTSPDTAYPVTIDPSFKVMSGNNNIHDATIYTRYGYNDGYNGEMYVGNYNNRFGGTRGTARTLIKFPNLATDARFYLLDPERIIDARLCLYDCRQESDQVRIQAHAMTTGWTEGTVKCSYSLWNAYESEVLDYFDVCSEWGAYPDHGDEDGNGRHWYKYDITDAVKDWRNGHNSPYNGIMLRATYETDDSQNKARTFGSSDNANSNYKPRLMITYEDKIRVSQVCISDTSLDMTVNNTALLTARVVPSNATNQGITWSSSDTSVATVSSSGLVCAKGAGTTTIYAKASDNLSIYAKCEVTVLPFISTFGNYQIVDWDTYQTYDPVIEESKRISEERYDTVEEPLLEMLEIKNRASISADGGLNIGMSDAGNALRHFLNNTGDTYFISLPRLIYDNKIAQYLAMVNFNDLLETSEKMLVADTTITVGTVSPIMTMQSPENFGMPEDWYTDNWWYTVGNANGWITAQITRSGNQFVAYVNYYLRDYYDWAPNSEARGGLVEDGEMARLHAAGYAKEFEVVGVYQIKLIWDKGQRIPQYGDSDVKLEPWS